MTVVPEVFPCEQDRAQFQHFAELPGIELYQAHISRYAFEPHTHEAFGLAPSNPARSATAAPIMSRRCIRW